MRLLYICVSTAILGTASVICNDIQGGNSVSQYSSFSSSEEEFYSNIQAKALDDAINQLNTDDLDAAIEYLDEFEWSDDKESHTKTTTESDAPASKRPAAPMPKQTSASNVPEAVFGSHGSSQQRKSVLPKTVSKAEQILGVDTAPIIEIGV